MSTPEGLQGPKPQEGRRTVRDLIARVRGRSEPAAALGSVSRSPEKGVVDAGPSGPGQTVGMGPELVARQALRPMSGGDVQQPVVLDEAVVNQVDASDNAQVASDGTRPGSEGVQDQNPGAAEATGRLPLNLPEGRTTDTPQNDVAKPVSTMPFDASTVSSNGVAAGGDGAADGRYDGGELTHASADITREPIGGVLEPTNIIFPSTYDSGATDSVRSSVGSDSTAPPVDTQPGSDSGTLAATPDTGARSTSTDSGTIDASLVQASGSLQLLIDKQGSTHPKDQSAENVGALGEVRPEPAVVYEPEETPEITVSPVVEPNQVQKQQTNLEDPDNAGREDIREPDTSIPVERAQSEQLPESNDVTVAAIVEPDPIKTDKTVVDPVADVAHEDEVGEPEIASTATSTPATSPVIRTTVNDEQPSDRPVTRSQETGEPSVDHAGDALLSQSRYTAESNTSRQQSTPEIVPTAEEPTVDEQHNANVDALTKEMLTVQNNGTEPTIAEIRDAKAAVARELAESQAHWDRQLELLTERTLAKYPHIDREMANRYAEDEMKAMATALTGYVVSNTEQISLAMKRADINHPDLAAAGAKEYKAIHPEVDFGEKLEEGIDVLQFREVQERIRNRAEPVTVDEAFYDHIDDAVIEHSVTYYGEPTAVADVGIEEPSLENDRDDKEGELNDLDGDE